MKSTVLLACEVLIPGFPRGWIALTGVASPLAFIKLSFSSASGISGGMLYNKNFSSFWWGFHFLVVIWMLSTVVSCRAVWSWLASGNRTFNEPSLAMLMLKLHLRLLKRANLISYMLLGKNSGLLGFWNQFYNCSIMDMFLCSLLSWAIN